MKRIEYKVLRFHLVVALAALVCLSAHAQSTESAASPEMARLAQALAGDWTTEEILQQGKPVPEGVGRKGDMHVRLTGGGTVACVGRSLCRHDRRRFALVHYDLVGQGSNVLSIADLFQNQDERWLRAPGNGALGGRPVNQRLRRSHQW